MDRQIWRRLLVQAYRLPIITALARPVSLIVQACAFSSGVCDDAFSNRVCDDAVIAVSSPISNQFIAALRLSARMDDAKSHKLRKLGSKPGVNFVRANFARVAASSCTAQECGKQLASVRSPRCYPQGMPRHELPPAAPVARDPHHTPDSLYCSSCSARAHLPATPSRSSGGRNWDSSTPG